MTEQEIRNAMMKLQHESLENLVKAQEVALKNLENAIEQGDSATVAAMAEILRT